MCCALAAEKRKHCNRPLGALLRIAHDLQICQVTDAKSPRQLRLAHAFMSPSDANLVSRSALTTKMGPSARTENCRSCSKDVPGRVVGARLTLAWWPMPHYAFGGFNFGLFQHQFEPRGPVTNSDTNRTAPPKMRRS